MGIENRDKTTTERNDSREGGMTEDNQKISSQVIAWATGQPFNNVLLLAILFAIGWSGYYAVTTAIPKHLEQIQKGYQSLTDAHREERKELRETYGQWMKKETAARPSQSTAAISE